MTTPYKPDWNSDWDNDIAHIADQLLSNRAGFLFGAGMSIPSGGIPATELAFELVLGSLYKHASKPLNPSTEESLRKVAQKFPLEAVAQGAVASLPFSDDELEQLLRTVTFKGETPEIHSGHRLLASIVAKVRLRLLFTTNWDNLLKDALGDSGAVITEQKFRDLDRKLDQGKTAVIHLHGTFEDSPLIKERDLMDADRPLFQVFVGELLSKVFVFVGYSLGDPNIRSLYHKIDQILQRKSEKLGKTTYVISPPASEADLKLSTAVWRSRHAKYIPLGAEQFFLKLHDQLTTHSLSALKDRLRTRLNVSLEDLQVKLDEIVSVFPQFENPEQVLLYLDAITRGGRT